VNILKEFTAWWRSNPLLKEWVKCILSKDTLIKSFE
jgi:hypothetical protein